MILCLSFERGMVNGCNPGMFLVLGHRAHGHCTCRETRNKKETLLASAADLFRLVRYFLMAIRVGIPLGIPPPPEFGQRVRNRLKNRRVESLASAKECARTKCSLIVKRFNQLLRESESLLLILRRGAGLFRSGGGGVARGGGLVGGGWR